MDRSQLLRMSRGQLDELFKQSPPGNIPEGEGAGTPIVFAGSWLAKFCAWLTRLFFWQGKIFDAQTRSLRNRITAFSLKSIKADVYEAPSWLDERQAIVLDYSKTSLVARKIRDEIREVAPGLYLGKVWWGRKPLIHFIINFRHESVGRVWRRIIAAACLVALGFGLWLAVRLRTDQAVAYDDIIEHFKYGSTGGERGLGIPYSVLKLLPEVFFKYLPDKKPGQGYASFGFIYEKNQNGKPRDLPIGFSKRNYRGVDRVFVNCAACHVGSVRDTPQSEPRIVLGMPSNTVDLEGFTRFLIASVRDERFTAQDLSREIARAGTEDWFNRLAFRLIGINLTREGLLTLGYRFRFLELEPDCGPGRFDTFNPPKALFNFPFEDAPPEERIGLCDFPSIWNQGKRKQANMHLHWDGNNVSVEERNRSAAFGTGATPPTLERENVRRIENWLLDAKPLKYPYTIDEALAAKGEPLYAQYCADCHGRSGDDFRPLSAKCSNPDLYSKCVGKITPIGDIKTDRRRLDNYTFDLCVNQNLLYAGYGDERFSHFRKTFGYANQPLDGIWLRAPYLHNGSAPALRDLLEPAEQRPKEFYRGYDVYDPQRVGFVSNVAEENGRKFFRYDTRLPGNGNYGHEGPEYGTHLSPKEKDAIVEYLKRF